MKSPKNVVQTLGDLFANASQKFTKTMNKLYPNGYRVLESSAPPLELGVYEGQIVDEVLFSHFVSQSEKNPEVPFEKRELPVSVDGLRFKITLLDVQNVKNAKIGDSIIVEIYENEAGYKTARISSSAKLRQHTEEMEEATA